MSRNCHEFRFTTSAAAAVIAAELKRNRVEVFQQGCILYIPKTSITSYERAKTLVEGIQNQILARAAARAHT